MDIVSIGNVLFSFIRMVAVILTVVFVAFVAYPIQMDIAESNEAEQIALDTSSILLSSTSPLTYKLAVFDPDELDKFNSTNKEPYASPCKFGYFAEIEEYDKEGKTKEKWSFGYSPSSLETTKKDVKEFEIGILQEGEYPFYNSVTAGKLKISVYKTWLTELSCIVERAYTSNKIQQISGERCPNYIKGTGIASFNIYTSENSLCVQTKTGEDCRHMEFPITVIGSNIRPEDKESVIIKAIPVSSASANCETAEAYISSTKPNAVLLCIIEEK